MSKKNILNIILALTVAFVILIVINRLYKTLTIEPEPFEGYNEITRSARYQAISKEDLPQFEEGVQREVGTSYARYLYCQENLNECSNVVYNSNQPPLTPHDEIVKDLINRAGYSELYENLDQYRIEKLVSSLDFDTYTYDPDITSEANETRVVHLTNLENIENSYSFTIKNSLVNGIILSERYLDNESAELFNSYFNRQKQNLGSSEVELFAEFNSSINEEIKIYPSRGLALLDSKDSNRKIYVFTPSKEFEESLAKRFINLTFPIIRPPISDFIIPEEAMPER